MEPTNTPEDYTIKIWIDDADVLERGGSKMCGKSIKERMVLDYDLWMMMKSPQNNIKFKLTWQKVDSYIETRHTKTVQILKVMRILYA